MIDVEELKRLLKLVPLEKEGGFYRETYRSADALTTERGRRSESTAIYYLLTHDTCSLLHRLKSDEIYHFYLGDPVELVLLGPSHGEKRILGPDIVRGMHVQTAVPKGVWQGSRLVDGGNFALLGTTMSPGFEFEDFALGDRDELFALYPWLGEDIIRLTPPSSSK
jgi:predicted cupin superfamily sugar epimerase